jgi:hypothetical protein
MPEWARRAPLRLGIVAVLIWGAAIVGTAPHIFQFSLVQTHYAKPLGAWRYAGLVVFLLGVALALSCALPGKLDPTGQPRSTLRRLLGPAAALAGVVLLGGLLLFHRGDDRTLPVSLVNVPSGAAPGRLSITRRKTVGGWVRDEALARWMRYYDNVLSPLYPDLGTASYPLRSGELLVPLPGPNLTLLKAEATGYSIDFARAPSRGGPRAYRIQSIECGSPPKTTTAVVRVRDLTNDPHQVCFGEPLRIDFAEAP